MPVVEGVEEPRRFGITPQELPVECAGEVDLLGAALRRGRPVQCQQANDKKERFHWPLTGMRNPTSKACEMPSVSTDAACSCRWNSHPNPTSRTRVGASCRRIPPAIEYLAGRPRPPDDTVPSATSRVL